ncbi:oxidative stress defense protein [Enterobacteriaceae bacterium LUAb1]
MKFKTLALMTMMNAALFPFLSSANELPNTPHIVTSGQASIDATPDMATLLIQVSVSSKEAAEAKKQADARVAQYFDFLEKNDIEKKDINAANVQTQPEYDYLKEGKAVLKGYRAMRQVEVSLHKLETLNNLLDGALKSGLNEIRSVELGVASADEYRAKARQAAIENAKSQARALATGFNATLGAVYSIRYHTSAYHPVPVASMYKAAASAVGVSVDETYKQQSIHFDDQVDVVFQMQPN